MRPNAQVRYVGADGRLTLDGMILLGRLSERLAAAEARLAAIGDVVDPTGGATQDAEARAAVASIIGAAQ